MKKYKSSNYSGGLSKKEPEEACESMSRAFDQPRKPRRGLDQDTLMGFVVMGIGLVVVLGFLLTIYILTK